MLVPEVGRPSETFIARHTDHFGRGGIPLVAAALAPRPHWAAPNGQVVLKTIESGNRHLRGIRVVAAAFFNSPRLLLPRRSRDLFEEFLQQQRPDVVFGEFLDFSLPFVATAAARGIPVVLHAHGYDVSARPRRWAWRRLYRHLNTAHAVVVVSSESREKLIELGVHVPIHVIPCGVMVPMERSQPHGRQGVHILAVGRMVAKKSPLATVRAFAIAQRDQPGLELDFVGDGPLFRKVAAYVANHQLVGIRLHGALSHADVERLMRDADIFVQHSVTDERSGDREGVPVAVLEAMSYGIPVVATRHAGIQDAIVDGVHGLLVPEGDVEGMAVRLTELARDSARRQTLGDAARARVREHFTLDTEFARLDEVVSEAVASPERCRPQHHSVGAKAPGA